MSYSLTISAPSRLHFGLLRFGQNVGKSYGGLGVMIDQPRVEIKLQVAEHWHAEGPLAERALEIARRVSEKATPDNSRPLHIKICKLPPTHSGLGTGTQLAFAIALGIHKLHELPTPAADQLATLTGRGKRSAVGSHGFLLGGLIWETGLKQSDTLGSLAKHQTVPNEWRILLIRLPQTAGLHGDCEGAAFKHLPPIPTEVTEKLQAIVEQTILPAVLSADFQRFSQGLYEYGYLSGSCFSTVQGGPFASQDVSNLVNHLRDQGVHGVGQSSWGPTVFAFTQNEARATNLAAHLKSHPDFATAAITLTSVAPYGAVTK